MSLATYPSQRFYKCGAKQTTWPTEVALGAGNEMLVTKDGDPALKQAYKNYLAIGRVMPTGGRLGAKDAVDFTPEFDMNYMPGAIGSLIGGLFGVTGVAVSGDGQLHTFQWANEAAPPFTFATTRPGAVWVIPAAIPMKLALSVADGLLHGALTLRGNDLIATSVLNTETEMDALTPEAEADLDFVNFQEGVAWMNTQAGDALDSGDAIELSDFNADFERAMDAKIVMGASQIAQPKEGNFNIGLKVRFPSASSGNVAYLASFIAMTPMKMQITFTGRLIAGTTYFSLSLYFPRLKFTGPPDVKLADIMDAGAEFIAEEAAAAPAGMSYTRPYLQITNSRAAAYTT